MPIPVKSLNILSISLLLLVCAGNAFPQEAPAAKPKTAASATADEVIPPADPNALFPAVVARVDGQAILGRDLERMVRAQLATIGSLEWNKLREDYRGQLVLNSINTLINSKLMFMKAVATGLKATDAEVQEEMQKISKSFRSDAEMNIALANQHTDRASLEKELYQTLAISKYIEENITKKVSVTDEEVAKYYSSNPTQFQHGELSRVSHILIQPASDTPEQDSLAKQRAEALLARAQKGEDFAKLARENSMDASASQGGDIGFYSKENVTPEFADALSMPTGSTRIVKTNAGYHVVKITEKKQEGLYTLDEIKTQLAEMLKSQKAEVELTKLVNQLRNEAKIEILIPAGQPLKP